MKARALRLSLRVLVPVACLGVAGETQALPRFSARYRQNCNLCHEDPTGSGLRSPYASQFLLPHDLAATRFAADSLADTESQLSRSFTLGTDVRTVYAASDHERPEKNFFQMEANLYVSLRADPRFSVYLNRGQSTSYELFGLGYLLPFNGYVKIGRFTPEFGWRFDDHTHFTRRELWFEPPTQIDQGIEIGLYPRRLALTLSALNGDPGKNFFDGNDELAVAARALYRFGLGSAGFGLGGSYWHNTEIAGVRSAGGPLGYLNWGRLTWVGEADLDRLDPPGAPPAVTGLVMTHELGFELARGWSLLATYDYVDPDIDHRTGFRDRYGIGLDVLATPVFGLQAILNACRFGPGLAISDVNYRQGQIQFHFYY